MSSAIDNPVLTKKREKEATIREVISFLKELERDTTLNFTTYAVLKTLLEERYLK